MFVISIPYLSLDQLYSSGQVFRWRKIHRGKYLIQDGHTILKAEQKGSNLMLSCSQQEFFDKWYYYFTADIDYEAVFDKAISVGGHVAKSAKLSRGVRVLRQDPFETIITFMLATATNIPRIKLMVNSLCMICGEKHKQAMEETGIVTWYEFPTAEQILANESELDVCKMGYRKDNIVQFCMDIEEGWLSLDELQSMQYEDAKKYLMQFRGIGEKVADCICLYGLGHHQAFPVDVHIEHILNREYHCDYDTFAAWYLDDLRGYEGIIQQYLYHNEITVS